MNAILRSPRMRLACLLLCCLLALTACDVKKTSTRTKSGDTAMLRNQIPPLFKLHRTSFICVYRDAVVPPVDPMAEALVQEAQWVEWNNGSPSWEKDKLWPHIIELNRRAAALGSWKARLNLVNLRLEGHGEQCGLPRDSEAAVREVEAEMARGIPDAWETMGRFYEQGIGVNPSSTKAYAFYQRAAEMGSPAAQAFLGRQLDATYDDTKAGFSGNEVNGRQMLECAVAQGYGPAAYKLGISLGVTGARNPADKAKALKVLHEGVKMGNADCAHALAIDLEDPQGRTSVAPQGVDLSRSERYRSIARSLEWYEGSGLTLPNLDKILPLPPARLPPWDGNRDSLIEAARPVRVLNNTPPPTYPAAPSAGQSRRVLPEPSIFLQGGARPTAQKQAPQSGYWQARMNPDHPLANLVNGNPLRQCRVEPATPGTTPSATGWLQTA